MGSLLHLFPAYHWGEQVCVSPTISYVICLLCHSLTANSMARSVHLVWQKPQSGSHGWDSGGCARVQWHTVMKLAMHGNTVKYRTWQKHIELMRIFIKTEEVAPHKVGSRIYRVTFSATVSGTKGCFLETPLCVLFLKFHIFHFRISELFRVFNLVHLLGASPHPLHKTPPTSKHTQMTTLVLLLVFLLPVEEALCCSCSPLSLVYFVQNSNSPGW